MNNCLDMPVCEHVVSVKDYCVNCNLESLNKTIEVHAKNNAHFSKNLSKVECLLHDFIASANGRIEKLQNNEALIKQLYPPMSKQTVNLTCQYLEDRIDKLESLINDINQRTLGYPATRELIAEHIKKIENRLSNLEKNLSFQMEVFKTNFARIEHIKSKKPHQCPLCAGIEVKSINIVRTASGKDKLFIECHACEGKGIIWG